MRTLLATLAILGLCSCGSKAPRLTFCVLRAVEGEPIELFCSHPDIGSTVVPVDQADKYICQPKRDAELLREYVLRLERKNP